jgi:hypothetical protein
MKKREHTRFVALLSGSPGMLECRVKPPNQTVDDFLKEYDLWWPLSEDGGWIPIPMEGISPKVAGEFWEQINIRGHLFQKGELYWVPAWMLYRMLLCRFVFEGPSDHDQYESLMKQAGMMSHP